MQVDKKLIVVIGLAVAFIGFVTIIPAMLSAENDISVITGVVLVVITLYCAFKYFGPLVEMFTKQPYEKEKKNEED